MTEDPIWIDVRPAQDPDQGLRGIGRYVLEHAKALVEHHGERIDGVVCDRLVEMPERLQWLRDGVQVRWADELGPRPPAIYHVMSPFEPLWPYDVLWPPAARGRGARLVVTVYDLIPKVLPDYRLHGGRRTRYEARLQLVSRADHVLAISAVTATDVHRIAKVPEDRITVIDAGISGALDARMTVAAAAEVLATRLPGLRRGFPLYVGGADPRKNLEGLVRAWGATDPDVRRGRPLVICGHAPPDRVEALEREAHEVGLAPHELLQTGYVTDLELAALYRACGVFVFPSFYEGSGLPMLEAMKFGIPVIAAAASTTPDILGDAEGTFDPADVAEMSRVMTRSLVDDEFRARLRSRSRRRSELFTWERVARRTVEGYDVALRRRPRGPAG